jgi:glycosyltransferase involved in cell wall biosynthesis
MASPWEGLTLREDAVWWVGYTWAVLRELHRLTESTPFDVINFPEWGAEGFAYLLNNVGHASSIPAIVHLHGPLAMFVECIGWPEQDGLLHRVGTFMEEISIQLAYGLTASSAYIADYVSTRYGVPREAIDVVHGGVDCDAFQPPPESARMEGPPTVLFVGAIAEHKGITTLCDAVLRLRSKYPDIRFEIVGTGYDPVVQALRTRIARAGAESNVQLCGFVDRSRLPEFYRRAHVFSSPAQYEFGVANVYIEAMASGCPVVASTAGGAPEAVVHGETGLLVPPDNVEATAAALDRILTDASLRRQMAEASRRRAEEYFALDKYILRVLAAYQKAIERVRATGV